MADTSPTKDSDKNNTNSQFTPVATPSSKRRITYRINLQRADKTKEIGHAFGVNSLSINAQESHQVFSAGRDSTIIQWEIDKTNNNWRSFGSFEGHTDWVNDVVAISTEKLASCSSDKSIKLWNISEKNCIKTLNMHQDYVKGLAFTPSNPTYLASASLDGTVQIIDLTTMKHSTTFFSKQEADIEPPKEPSINNQSDSSPIDVRYKSNSITSVHPTEALSGKYKRRISLYSIAINSIGNWIASGTSSGVLQLWDSRVHPRSMSIIRAHTDNLRSIVMNHDGTQCLTGSSDKTVKLWDLRQRKCVHSFIHNESVWSISVDQSFSRFFSTTRDKKVFVTDLIDHNNYDNPTLILETEEPVIKSVYCEDPSGLWLASTSPALQFVKYNPKQSNKQSDTIVRIETSAGVVRHHLLNNKRMLLIQDSSTNISLWDITKGERIKEYGQANSDLTQQQRDQLWEETIKDNFEMISVPSWCTIEPTGSSVDIHLDFPNCFSAEVLATEGGFPSAKDDSKVNIGAEVLKTLLSYWKEAQPPLKQETAEPSNETKKEETKPTEPSQPLSYEMPPDIPVIIYDIGPNSAAYQLDYRRRNQYDGSEQSLPFWLVELLLHNRLPPREDGIGFYLEPEPNEKSLDKLPHGQTKLNANRNIRVRKIASYVVTKLNLKIEGDPADHILILCNNKVLSPDISLATAKSFFWKSSDDLILHYTRAIESPTTTTPKKGK